MKYDVSNKMLLFLSSNFRIVGWMSFNLPGQKQLHLPLYNNIIILPGNLLFHMTSVRLKEKLNNRLNRALRRIKRTIEKYWVYSLNWSVVLAKFSQCQTLQKALKPVNARARSFALGGYIFLGGGAFYVASPWFYHTFNLSASEHSPLTLIPTCST